MIYSHFLICKLIRLDLLVKARNSALVTLLLALVPLSSFSQISSSYTKSNEIITVDIKLADFAGNANVDDYYYINWFVVELREYDMQGNETSKPAIDIVRAQRVGISQFSGDGNYTGKNTEAIEVYTNVWAIVGDVEYWELNDEQSNMSTSVVDISGQQSILRLSFDLGELSYTDDHHQYRVRVLGQEEFNPTDATSTFDTNEFFDYYGNGNSNAEIAFSSPNIHNSKGTTEIAFNLEDNVSGTYSHIGYLEIDYKRNDESWKGFSYVRHASLFTDQNFWTEQDAISSLDSYIIMFENGENERSDRSVQWNKSQGTISNRLTLSIDLRNISRFSSAEKLQFRVRGKFLIRENDGGTKLVDVSERFGEEIDISEEDSNFANELDLSLEEFNDSGAIQVGFNIEKREGESFYDHTAAQDLWYRVDGGGWNILATVRHQSSIFDGFVTDIESTEQTETFAGPDGDAYQFKTAKGVRVFARDGLFYTSEGDVAYSSGDVMMYFAHYIDSEDFGSTIEYKLGNKFYLRDYFGRSKKVEVWNTPATTITSIASNESFNLIPSVADLVVNPQTGGCGVEVAWTNPSRTGWGDSDRHRILIFRDSDLIATLDPDDGSVFIDENFEPGIQYSYQVSAGYERYINGPLNGPLSAAENFTYPQLDAPAGLLTTQAGCDGGITVSWVWSEGNPTNFVLQRQSKNSFETIVPNLNGTLRDYTDNEVAEGIQYTYRIAAQGGDCNFMGSFSSPRTHTRDTINLAPSIAIGGLETSKGYYSDRTELFWKLTGENEEFVNRFRVYARQVGTNVIPTLVETLDRDDRSFFHERGDANVIYEYFVIAERVIETVCGFETTQSFNIEAVDGLTALPEQLPDSGVAYAIGLRSPMAVLNGNITYQGGIAVPNVKVVVEPEDQVPGKSLYFNGNAQVLVPNSKYLELDTAITLSAWVKPDNLNPNVMLFKEGSYGLEFNGTEAFMFVRNNLDQSAAVARVPSEAYVPGNWVNLTCTYSSSSGELNLYVNGVKTGEPTIVEEGKRIINMSSSNFIIGNYSTSGYEFQGNIDEVRIYNRALKAEEVLREHGRITASDSKGLIAYWKVFEGTGSSIYDASHLGSFYYKHDGQLQGVSWSDDIPSQTQLGIAGYTNSFGNYSIEGIPFSGSGENFRITPTVTLEGIAHEFDPSSKSVFLGEGNTVENGVDFEDISSFQISGSIVYDFEDEIGSGNKPSGSSGVQLYLDGITPLVDVNDNPITTNSSGEFNASIPIGLHYITFEKENHTFSEGGRWPTTGFHNFQADVNGISLLDKTIHTFVGTVAGGTRSSKSGIYSLQQINNIGEAYFEITSKGNIISRTIETDSLSGVFEIGLPPLVYDFSSVKWSIDDQVIVSSGEIKSLNMGSEEAFKGIFEVDSTLLPVLRQNYPTPSSQEAISGFKIDSITATKIHYSWTLNNPNLVTQKHIWVSDTDTTEYFSNTNGSGFPTGLSDHDVTFFGDLSYNVNNELPKALLLEFVDSSSETYQVGIQFEAFKPVSLLKYDTTGFEYVKDSTFFNIRRDFIHRELPTLEVVTAGDTLFTGESSFGNADTDLLAIDLNQLPYPSFFTNEFYKLEVRANEIYTNRDNGEEYEIAVTDGDITVNNGIGISYLTESNGEKSYFEGSQLSLNEEGLAEYYFVGSDPSFVQITSTGEEHNSFTKTINITLETGGQAITWPANPTTNPQRAYVMGAAPIAGANFVTAAPETLEFILRDPPGSDSYAFREAGTTFSVSEEFVASGFGAFSGSQGLGFGFEIAGGGSFGGHIEIGGEASGGVSAGLNVAMDASSGATVERSMETTETIQTNDEPIELGTSDIFVAKSYNLQTGYALKVRPLSVSDCGGNCFGEIITMSDGSQFQMGVVQSAYINPEGAPTYAVYTQNHIESVLIPDIEELRNSVLVNNSAYSSILSPDHSLYGSNNDDPRWGTLVSSSNYTATEIGDLSGESYIFDNGGDDTQVDSVRWFNQQIRLWEEGLAFNEIEKWAAMQSSSGLENISLASGVQLERASTNTASSTSMITLETSTSLALGVDVSLQFLVAASMDLSAELGLKTTSTSTRGEETSNTFGYVLRDSDENDSYSIDVLPGVGGNGTVFSTVAGQTSCPFEPGLEMQYATPEYIGRAIQDREALVAKLIESKNMTSLLKEQLDSEIAAIQDEVKDLESDVTSFAESQIELIKSRVDAVELFNDIQGIAKELGENAANALVQKAVGPVVGGVNDFIGTLHDINIPVPFTRGVSPFESIPKIPTPENSSGDFNFDFGQVEQIMLSRLKEAEEIGTETINRTTELITKLQNKIKKRLLDLNNLTILVKEYELDLDGINAEIDAVNEQIVQFQALQQVLNNAVEPIMLSNTTLQREKPTLLINGADAAQVYNVPAHEKANFTLLLGNESESGDAMFYDIQVIANSNPNGLVLSVDGLNITSPREFFVEGNGAIQKVLSVERGPFEYEYEDVKVIISSTCQYDPSGNTALIADTVSFDVSYIPVCTDLAIAAPSDKWVGNNSNGGVLPITISEYDINTTGLETIRVQYKSQEASEWTLLETYYRDENAIGWEENFPVLPQSGNSFQVQWDISGLPDGFYDIRAVSNCALAETVSEIHSGTIDKVNPHPFGSPEPADGIYSAGDEISIQFNEPINEGLLRPSNFSIEGVLNGGAIRHNASVLFGGQEDQFMEIAAGMDLTRKSFTVDFQIKRKGTGEEVIFSQGGASERSLIIGFDANNQPFLSINGMLVTSNQAIIDSDWHHLAFVYDHHSTDAFIYDNTSLVGTNNSFEIDYQSSGKVLVGKSTFEPSLPFNGNVHELRVWNLALSYGEIVSAASTQYTSNKRGLLANWKMDEASGAIAKDLVRNIDAAITAQWEVEPGGLAYFFDGSQMLKAASPSFNASTDFTIELWVNGSTTGDSTTFISNGHGSLKDGNSNAWAIGANGQGEVFVKSNAIDIVSDKNVLDEKWHHVALSVSRVGNATVYVDGEELASTQANLFEGFGGSSLYIGARGWIDNGTEEIDQYFSGSLDEIRIWSLAKRSDHISTDIQSKLSGSEIGLELYYPFESYQKSGGIYTINQEIGDQRNSEAENDLIGSTPSSFVENTPTIKLPRPVERVAFNFSSNNDRIILSPTADSETLEDVVLTISVDNVKDLNGNRMSSPSTWTAFVDRSTLNWVEKEKSLRLGIGDGATFEASIFNRGGNVESFSLSNIPEWLKVTPSTGSIEPLATQVVHFEVSQNTNIGTYVQDVVMENSFGYDERLILNLNVYQPAPEDWTVNPADFEYSMSVLGRVRIKGEFSRDNSDLIAAFVNGECRGVAQLSYAETQDNFQAFLSVYSNEISGESVDYRIWNASEGIVHTFVEVSDVNVKTFSVDAFYGSVSNPMIFDAGNSIERVLNIESGWQWLSFNLISDDMNTVNDFMKDYPAANGDQVKSAEFFDQYDETTGWLGTITTNGGIQKEEMYKFKLSNDAKLKFRGEPAVANTTPIDIQVGWNWVGFLGQNLIPINEALSNVNGLQEGDVIKSQRQFATYGGVGLGWVGSLKVMTPGEGYLYRAANAGTVTYPQFASNGARVSTSDLSYLDLDGYQVNSSKYPNNMPMILKTDLAYDYVLALVDGEVRGVAPQQFNPEVTSPSYFMTVFGNREGEVTFIGLINELEVDLSSSEVVNFSSTNTYGSLKKPFELYGEPLSVEDHIFVIYPNPAQTEFTIRKLGEINSLQILSLEGKVIKTLNNVKENQPINVSDLQSGVYLVQAIQNGETKQVKLIKK